ncbi:class I SAM-dependent methyltransferase [Candidatus Dojkabacteria bacterium]|uniref:Class I SAM-dependent methyltransferase n=1 Tax=Candidatus Dojkabacteria bacterium TaxID=2099670 RepID=A0A955RL14_9BACT|nr:class I SAM-dependent methyltransferase [Candidatus Dojkabacteria bacterium]
MKVMESDTKFAHLGKPGAAFSKGFQRRLDLIVKQVDLKDKKILDQGCGEGVWMNQFSKFTSPNNVYGSDIDPESKVNYELQITNSTDFVPIENYRICPAEELDFKDNFFDIVFSNEVLEHVNDDKKSVEEVSRVLKPGGYYIVFTPNRGWPFETHGIFFNGKYYWGNIPFLPWMPKFIFKKFAPHVRNYSNREIESLFDKSIWDVTYHKHVFPGFDGAVRRFGIFGKLLQWKFHFLEKTPLHFFGISHFIIAKKK